jgi:radical SAM superfamily enzyme YgiQ (UPF0313 family)
MRFRHPENIHKEIEECVNKYGTNFVVFNDSTFTISKPRSVEIAKGLATVGIKGYHLNAHVNTVDFAMLETFAKTGCRKISYGVESGSDRVLKRIGKNASQKSIRKAFELSRRAGIPTVEATFILGADLHETEVDIRKTEELIKEIQPDIVAVGIITPYPGTSQFTEMKGMGRLENIPWESYNTFTGELPPWNIVNFTAQELAQRRNQILKSYYWNPRYIMNRMFSIKSLSEFAYYAGLAKSFYRVVIKQTI